MQLRSALLAAAMVALPLAAQAQPVTGLYVAGGVGVNFMQQEDVTTSGGPLSSSGQLKSRVGPTGVVSLGWGFGNGLRAEVEANYVANKFNSASGFNNITNAGGWEQKFGGMVNAFYDFNGLSPWIVPFVGLGVGYEATSLHGGTVYATTGGTVSVTNDTKGSFGYQAMLGAAFPIPAAPGLSFTAEYRFMGLAGDRTYSGIASVGHVSAPVSVKFNDEFNHAILIGLRYAFGVTPPPPPAPMAAPAPAPARSYLVFFDWDKATLTARAQQIISGSGGQLDQGAVHADRGERLHRYLGHAAVQPGSVGPPCASGGRRTGAATVCRRTRSPSRALARRTCWSRPDRACASRRTAASRSSSADLRPLKATTDRGAAGRPDLFVGSSHRAPGELWPLTRCAKSPLWQIRPWQSQPWQSQPWQSQPWQTQLWQSQCRNTWSRSGDTVPEGRSNIDAAMR